MRKYKTEVERVEAVLARRKTYYDEVVKMRYEASKHVTQASAFIRRYNNLDPKVKVIVDKELSQIFKN
jgi:hypothetical protein